MLETKPEHGLMGDEKASEIFSSSRVAFVITNPGLPDNPIVYVNQAFETLTGYSAQIALGQNCRFLQCAETDEKDVATLRKAIKDQQEVSLVLKNGKANGDVFLNALIVMPIYDDDQNRDDGPHYFLGMQREVDSDREADQLSAFENTVSEIQHRVKNHLAMILSLIRLKTREMEDQGVLGDISRRIESLQLLYEEMSAARQFTNNDVIQLGSYIGRVANAIAYIDGRHGVRMNIDVAPMEVETDRAARIGLVISEILTNSMQHAFKDQETGLVEIRAVRTDKGGLRVTISDDGVGIPEDVDWPDNGGLGGRIVQGLIKGLGGSLEVIRGDIGTVVIFDVKDV